jgi:hypothetical protein
VSKMDIICQITYTWVSSEHTMRTTSKELCKLRHDCRDLRIIRSCPIRRLENAKCIPPAHFAQNSEAPGVSIVDQ